MDKCKVNDCYHRAFFYVMGISEETRMNIGKMFDFKRDCIIPEDVYKRQEEYMPFDDDVAIICNEEGKMRGLPLNRAVYVQDNDKKEMVDIILSLIHI